MSYFNRQGKPIGMREWSRLMDDPDYRIVEQTQIGPFWLSTVWLGLDYQFVSGGPPLIFETMLFESTEAERTAERPERNPWTDLARAHWETEEQARAGHVLAVARLTEMVRTFGDGADVRAALTAGGEDG